MMAGSTLGGGTVVNWMTSFRTPDDILAEWINALDCAAASLTLSCSRALPAVEQRIQVNTGQSQHNRQNQALFDGAHRARLSRWSKQSQRDQLRAALRRPVILAAATAAVNQP